MQKKQTKKTGPRIGEGKRIVSIYADQAEVETFKKRAAELGLSLSQYFSAIALNEIEGGKDFRLPKRKGSGRK